MKDTFIKISTLFCLLLVAIAFNEASAASSKKLFGGTIEETTATEIQQKEDQNFKCIVPGRSITIRPKGSPKSTPTSFYISPGAEAKSRGNLKSGNLILGSYSQSKTTISCIYQGYPPRTETVQVDTIEKYGAQK